jgi:hypothetical protein
MAEIYRLKMKWPQIAQMTQMNREGGRKWVPGLGLISRRTASFHWFLEHLRNL